MQGTDLDRVGTVEEFVVALGALLRSTGKSSRAVAIETTVSNSVAHGLIKGTGGFPTEETVRLLATAYAPSALARWLSTRARVEENRPRPAKATVEQLQEQVDALRGQLADVLDSVTELVALNRAEAVSPEELRRRRKGDERARRDRLKRREANAHQWFLSRLHPVLSETKEIYRTSGAGLVYEVRAHMGYKISDVDAFLVTLRELASTGMQQVEEFVRTHAGKLTREESTASLAVYTTESVQRMLSQLNQDIAEYVWRATGDDPAATK